MKIKIGILGSCVTRDIFRSVFNNYEEYFEIISSLERVSLISLMDIGYYIEFNEKDIQIYPLNDSNKFRSERLRHDLSKNYIRSIGENIDYLIIDEFFEAYFGVIKINDTYITNNFWDYPDTKFYETINEKNKLTLYHNFLEYYILWRNSCDAFFDYFHENFPNVKIILNKVKLSSKVLKDDGSYYIDEIFQRELENYNPLIRVLENYLEKNHDVLVVDCTKDVMVNENHIWGKGFVNYCDEFYINAFEKILEIINENQLNNKMLNDDSNSMLSDSNSGLDFENYSTINVAQGSKLNEYLEIKKYLFEESSVDSNFIDINRLRDYLKYLSKNNYRNLSTDFQESSFNELIKINRFIVDNKESFDEETKNIENEINSKYFNENAEFLIKYLESRIDIKNYGNETNDIILLKSNDSSLKFTRPSWFKNENGVGSVVNSVKGDLNLSFKCVNDGRLVIGFKSIDYRDKTGNRIPIYIDYTEILVNDNVIVGESQVSWHDSPFIFEKDVKDGELINIKVRWGPINYKSNLFLETDYEKLINNFYEARIDVKNVGKENNDLILVDCDDSLSHIYKPIWFKDEFGVGTVVDSSSGIINISFKCINDGNLNIDFRAIDFKDRNNKRIPIFIDYTKIRVNDVDIIEDNVSVWHDNPFVYNVEVENNQIINIQAEWKPLSGNSNLPLIHGINSHDGEINKLKKEIDKLNNENRELNNLKVKLLSSIGES